MKKLMIMLISVSLVISFKVSAEGNDFTSLSKGDLEPSHSQNRYRRQTVSNSGDLSPSPQGNTRQNSYSNSNRFNNDNRIPESRSEQEFSRTTSAGLGANRYAIVVGQDAYISRPLTTCVNDARQINQMLRNNMGFSQENIRLFLDRQINKNRFAQSINEIARRAGQNDLVVIYYSGHGVRRESQRALLLTTQEYITTSEFTSWVSNIKAKTLVILDSCYAGGMYNPNIAEQEAAELKNSMRQNTHSNPNILFLASSTDNQISMTVRTVGLSRFTYFFLKSVVNGHGDVNGDNRLTLLEIYNWTKRETINHGLRFGNRHDPVLVAPHPDSIVITQISRIHPQIVRRDAAPDRIARRSAQQEDEMVRARRSAAPPDASSSVTIGGLLSRSAPVGDLTPADRHRWGGSEKQ